MLEIYALIKPVLALIWFRDCPRKLQCPRKSCLARKHKTWFSSVLLQRLGQFMVDTPLKFNIDTQSCHIWKEIHCKNHCFWVSIFNFGGVFYQIKCMHVHEGTCPSGERISTLRMTNIRPSLSTPSMNLKPPIMYWMKSRLHGESLRRFTYETWRKITCSSIRLIFSYIFHISPSIYLYIYIYTRIIIDPYFKQEVKPHLHILTPNIPPISLCEPHWGSSSILFSASLYHRVEIHRIGPE